MSIEYEVWEHYKYEDEPWMIKPEPGETLTLEEAINIAKELNAKNKKDLYYVIRVTGWED